MKDKAKKTKKVKEVQHEWSLLNKQKPIWWVWVCAEVSDLRGQGFACMAVTWCACSCLTAAVHAPSEGCATPMR